jgi:general stress protein YciG
MSGTKAGGLKAAQRIKEKQGSDFFARIGAIGGRNGHVKGFAINPELAREAGRIGGKISKRGPAKKKEEENVQEKED